MTRERSANALLSSPNQDWALDFVSDALASGRGLRGLMIVDSYTRECPAIEVASGIGRRQVTRTLERIIGERDKPQSLRCEGRLFCSSSRICTGNRGAGVRARSIPKLQYTLCVSISHSYFDNRLSLRLTCR